MNFKVSIAALISMGCSAGAKSSPELEEMAALDRAKTGFFTREHLPELAIYKSR
jgi:hypothetical protein